MTTNSKNLLFWFEKPENEIEIYIFWSYGKKETTVCYEGWSFKLMYKRSVQYQVPQETVKMILSI